jgi:hypothetical protein
MMAKMMGVPPMIKFIRTTWEESQNTQVVEE